MIEILLTLIALSILSYHAWYVREKNKEINSLVSALIAKTPEQYRDLLLAEKVKPIPPPVKTELDFIPESDISDKKFQELIKEGRAYA